MPNSATGYLYLYSGFLHFVHSKYQDDSFYSQALETYLPIAANYTKYNDSLANNPYFAEFNAFKFNMDLSEVCSFFDCKDTDTITTEGWDK